MLAFRRWLYWNLDRTVALVEVVVAASVIEEEEDVLLDVGVEEFSLKILTNVKNAARFHSHV